MPAADRGYSLPTASQVHDALKSPESWRAFVADVYSRLPKSMADAFFNSLALEPPGTRTKSGYDPNAARSPGVAAGASRPWASGVQVGSGGGGGGGAAPFDAAAARISLRAQFAMSGFAGLGFNIDKYIREAVRRRQGLDFVVGRIIEDPRFKRRFPGIMNADGTLRMTVTEYESKFDRYRELASQYGVKMSRNRFALTVRGELSENELAYRLRGVQLVRENKEHLAALNEVLKSRGIAPVDNAREAFRFVSGKRKDIDQIYEEAYHVSSARQLGLDVSAERAKELASQSEGHLTLEQTEQSYKNIADQLRQAGAELGVFGLSQRELEIIEFGGPNRAAVASKAEAALKQREAALQTTLSTQATGRSRSTGRPLVSDSSEAGF